MKYTFTHAMKVLKYEDKEREEERENIFWTVIKQWFHMNTAISNNIP